MTSSDALAAFRRVRERLSGVCDFRDVEVGELTFIEAHDLASALLERDDRPTTDAVASEAQGNPLFVAELARWANERREVARGAVALEQVILARVADLSEEARALLETISVARGPIGHAVAERAAGLTARRRTAAIALRGARFVSTHGLRDDDVLETSHDRIRETVAASLGDPQRRAPTPRAAPAPSQLRHASTWSLPSSTSWRRETTTARASTRCGRPRPPIRASRSCAQPTLYRAAIALHAGPRDLLYAKLGDALVNAGRSADAADAYMEAAAHAPGREATGLRRTAAEHYLKSGREEKGLAVLRDVLTEVGIRYPESREAAVASMLWHDARLRLSSLLPRVLRARRPQSLSPRTLRGSTRPSAPPLASRFATPSAPRISGFAR